MTKEEKMHESLFNILDYELKISIMWWFSDKGATRV